MESLQDLLDRNTAWAERATAADPQFFRRLVAQQAPQYLWIGCSDARVPANEIVDLAPGELFVHRNVANVVAADDANVQAVIEFAVSVLKVRHIMVVGHYGCGGVQAAARGAPVGPCCDRWLEHVHEVIERHDRVLREEAVEHRRHSLLCELNVLEQSYNVCKAPAVQAAWKQGQALFVHGWIYRLGDGRLRHMDFSVDGKSDVAALRDKALETILRNRKAYYAGKKPG
jgi:carbonic anhydrase